MSTQATIRSISPVHNGIGQVYGEELPPDVSRVELKYCEQCGKPFVRQFAPTQVKEERVYYSEYFFKLAKPVMCVRRVESGERYCAKCKYTPAPELRAEELLKDQENYKAQLPGTPNQMRHSMHLVRHEAPVGRATSSHRVNNRAERKTTRTRTDVTGWAEIIATALEQRTEVTMEELCGLLPRCYTPTQVYVFCRLHFPALKVVRRMTKEGIRGSYGVYRLESVN